MSTSTLTPAIIQELLEKHREVLLSSLAKMLPAPVTAPASSATPDDKKGRKKKEKKPVDPNAPPKEKRPPNSWILFSMRVEKLVRAAEELAGKTTKEQRMHTVVIKQFAASLKSTKPYDDWADDEITEAMTTWTPPEVSKMSAAKAEKALGVGAPASSDSASVASDASDAPAVADASGAPTPASKPKRVMSDEAKASMAAKRAATIAAKKALGGADAVADAAGGTTAADAPAPAVKKVTVKPKKAAATGTAPPPTDKKVDLSFFEWTHDGKEYYTNDRGDVVTTDFEWVGRFDGKTIDENAAEPADLSEATLRAA
jgi:hypothetical protein